ncbi:MAG: TonB-dependent receptor [Gammaproteobacteria bacterium]|nr:TonB-dependent receptor [Gammaproteobacteria bacterium]
MAAALLCAAAAHEPLFAQQATEAGASAAEANRGGLQEVVVTATRHEEALSRVPVSVTALTQESMDQLGIKDFQDVARFTPGVNIDTSGTNAISIRGISSSGGAGTTGIYIDDTPIQMRSVGFNPDDTLPKTFDLQRVEILRGPQGTLFGAGSEGGAVRYILTPPSATTVDTYIRTEGSYTQYGQPNAEFGIARGQPLVDGVFGVRGSLWYRYDGGWVNRVDPTTGAMVERNINFSNSVMARLAGVWQPTGHFSVTPSVLYQKQDKHDDSTFWPAYSDPARGRFNTATPERVGGPDDYVLPALKVQWDLGGSQIISNTSYFHRKQITAYQGTVYDLAYYQGLSGCTSSQDPGCAWFPLLDANGIHLPAGFTNFQTPNTMTNRQQSYTQEVRWQSSNEDAKWRWTAGLFWQLAKEGSIEELKDTQIEQFFSTVLGFTPESYYGGVFYSCPTNAAYPAIPACDIYYNNNTTFDRQVAAFGELSYAPVDWFRLTIGERVARTSFTLSHYADGYENFGPSPAQASQKETPNTPKLTLAFQVDPRDLYYFTYAKGFRVGGGNAPLPPFCNADLAAAGYPNGAPLTYRSDSTQNFEVGSKNAFGSWLKLALSVYYIKWNDIQQSLYVAGNCGLQFTDNLGTAVAKGFDLQAQMQFDALHIDLAGGYTSARYTKDSPSGCETQVGIPVIPCKSSDGDAISGQAAIDYAPGSIAPWTTALGVEYALRLGQRDAFVRADWEYESRNPWLAAVQDPHNQAVYNPYSYTPSANSFVSLRAGVNLGDWLVSAFMDNVFDSHTVLNYALVQPTPGVLPQQNQYTFRPRTIGITATWHAH